MDTCSDKNLSGNKQPSRSCWGKQDQWLTLTESQDPYQCPMCKHWHSLAMDRMSKYLRGTSGRKLAPTRSSVDMKAPLQSLHEERAKLGSACQQWGFFQLINHGVPNEVIHDLKKDMAEFFELPLEAKKAYSMLPNSLEGYGQAFVVSEDQKLDWADMFALVLRPVESRDIRFWPAHPPSFRNSIDRYSTETAKVARFLLELMAMDMGIEAESLLKVFQGQPQGLRMNYYPPCRQADKVLGLSPHTDAAGLTLQLQVTDVPGLQIKRDGKWFAVDALDGALLVIIGDILEILSNGRYRCAVHRAVVHPSRERISAAVFHRACQDAVVGPLPELVEAGGGKARYRSVGFLDYMKRYFSGKLDGRSQLDSMRIEL